MWKQELDEEEKKIWYDNDEEDLLIMSYEKNKN